MKSQSPVAVSDVGEYQFDESVGYLLARVKSTMLNMITQRTMDQFGITSTQARILFMVASGRCELAAELTRECGVDASSVTRMADWKNADFSHGFVAAKIGARCAPPRHQHSEQDAIDLQRRTSVPSQK
jgi:hypothetical protein